MTDSVMGRNDGEARAKVAKRIAKPRSASSERSLRLSAKGVALLVIGGIAGGAATHEVDSFTAGRHEARAISLQIIEDEQAKQQAVAAAVAAQKAHDAAVSLVTQESVAPNLIRPLGRFLILGPGTVLSTSALTNGDAKAPGSRVLGAGQYLEVVYPVVGPDKVAHFRTTSVADLSTAAQLPEQVAAGIEYVSLNNAKSYAIKSQPAELSGVHYQVNGELQSAHGSRVDYGFVTSLEAVQAAIDLQK